jgi:ribosomal protein L3 glutamine methyltransferase
MTASPADTSLADLITVRDWLRSAVSRFEAAGLIYGHGTTGPVDEAAFLILKTLHLPIETLDPWLDCRLTQSERAQVSAILDARITTRKPACYLVNEAWIQGLSFYVDERVIVPRSYIGELLRDRLSAVVADADDVERALDLCTGSGCLAILTARAFPNADVDAVDISEAALEIARQNVGDYGLNDRISVIASDIFMGVANQRYDLILANPPYVSDEVIADFPPEYRAEPVLAHAGGKDGLDLVRRILKGARQHLTENGMLVVEIGTGRDILEAEFPALEFLWLDTENSEGEVFALAASALAPIAGD